MLKTKKNINLIFNIRNNSFAFCIALFGTLRAFSSRILSSDKAKKSKIIPKKYDIIEEYIIWGS